MVLLKEIFRGLFTGNKDFSTNMIEGVYTSCHDQELDTEPMLKTVASFTEYCKARPSTDGASQQP